MTSFTSAFLLKPEERDYVHLLALASYILITELTALMSFQFIFFYYSILKRYEAFYENLTSDLELQRNVGKSIKLHSDQLTILATVMDKINSTFSIEVSIFN